MEAAYNLKAFLHYHRRMFMLMAMICLMVFIGLLLAMRQDFTWSGGFLLGAAAQLLKFRFLDIAVIQKIAIEKRDPAGVQLKAAFVTLLLFGAAAAAVLKLGYNVWAMALGIFLPRLILIADTYLRPNPFGDEPEPAETAAGKVPSREPEKPAAPQAQQEESSDNRQRETASRSPTPNNTAETHGNE